MYGHHRTDLPTTTHGLTPELLAAVEAARAAEDAQVKETGEAQRATVLRDATARAVRVHAGELAEVSKVALDDRPQLRETLGLRQR